MTHGRTATLIGESFSPWTQKARWALAYCRVPHAYREYVPVIGTPALRWRTGNWTRPASVPVLLTADGVVQDSWHIARYANTHSRGGDLGNFAAIAPWNSLGDEALAEARMRVLRRLLDDSAALDEAAGTTFPSFLRKPSRPLTRTVVRRLQRKYAHLERSGALVDALIRTRQGLAATGCDFLLGGFSYADIAMLVVLQAVAPRAATVPPLGEATRRCWSDEVLAREFEDLLAWRERIAASEYGCSQFASAPVTRQA